MTTHESRLHFNQNTVKNTKTKTDINSFKVQPNHPNTELFKYTNEVYRKQKEKKYQKALKHLSAAQSANAKHQLAQMYERGLGVKINFYRSYMLYTESLKLGQKKAKKDVARLAKLKTGKEKAHYDKMP